jgi:16S rRNA C967 or C1407 C5-methylase (RsmB/RsmF family)/NOL1/NOP2/fmu family ribosome biogenesis protein
MKLPVALLESLEGTAGFDRDAFMAVHQEAIAPTSVRLNQPKWPPKEAEPKGSYLPFQLHPSQQVPWAQLGYYLPQRPSFTFDPLFHAGCYYVQEASSMFLEQPFRQLLNLSQPLKVLDLCAAPGGKSTHIQSLLSPGSLLVSNEVIKTRSIVLTDNIIRWGCKNVFVTNNDPRAFQKTPGYFDVMVVDAPCSGSGLFRKDEEAIQEWSLNNVALCSQRQQRILADALPALKEDGLLIYSTCSYSTAEDEEIMDWLAAEMELDNVPLQVESFHGIVETGSTKTGTVGYRFYPDKIKGEGFFLSCFRKRGSAHNAKLRSAKLEMIAAREKKVIEDWVANEGLSFIRFRDEIIAIPENLLPEFSVLQPNLNIQYAGTTVGEVLKEKLVPHHALAQSLVIAKNIPAIDLSYDEAIKYLQRQDLSIAPETTGWQVVRFQDQNLGWINALKNRINNYYPKEIRILKARNDSAFEK